MKIDNALKEVDMEGRGNQRIYELSGGEQQRISLARVILKDAPYILADEPTGNLDIDNTRLVYSILSKLHQTGKTIIVVKHEKTLLEKFDKVICI